MGCFNQSCFISRLDIKRGDKCLVLLMLPNVRSEVSLNDRSFRLFKPFALPILGVYNDYGGIEKIKNDENTILLEKYFDLPIDKILEIVSSSRDDFYSQYSVIQQMYGVPGVMLTPEGLAKMGFITDADKKVTHPRLTWLFDLISKMETSSKDAKETVSKISIFWNDGDLVFQGWYSEQMVYKKGQDAQRFLEDMHRMYESLAEKNLWVYKEPFVFGIPQEKQARALLLNKLRIAFIRYDVYKVFATKSRSLINSRNASWNKDWEKKGEEEYTKLVSEWQAMLTQVKADEKNPPTTEEERQKATRRWMRASEPHEMWNRTHLGAFQSTYTGEEFLAIYGDSLLDEDIRGRFREFGHVHNGLDLANILLVETHSWEQHGDLDAQVKLLECMVKVGKKVRDERWADR